VETLRLKLIQQPSQVDRLLYAFVLSSGALPEEACQVRDRADLTDVLRDKILKAERNGWSWGCWTTGNETWLFTGEMSLALSRERGLPVLRVNRYDKTGLLVEAGRYASDPRGRWQRCGE
jgi:hypothetical protein